MHDPTAAATKQRIKADILLKEFDRVVWEIHNRVEYRQRLINLQLLFIGALTAAYATTLTKTDPTGATLSALLWHTVPFLAIIFTVFLKEISHQNYYRFTAASYINTFLRPKLQEMVGESGLIEWECHLRTEPEDRNTIKRKKSSISNDKSYLAWMFFQFVW